MLPLDGVPFRHALDTEAVHYPPNDVLTPKEEDESELYGLQGDHPYGSRDSRSEMALLPGAEIPYEGSTTKLYMKGQYTSPTLNAMIR